jgi:putative membrane protein
MRKYPLLILLLSAGALALACQAMAQRSARSGATAGAGVNEQDQAFLRNASADGAAEVSLGQLALQRSSSPQVQQLARRIVSDHTKANRQLAQLATQERVAVPAQPKPEAVQESQKLHGLQGSEFDRAYADCMVRDHHKAIALFTQAAQSGNPAIRQFARSTLPALKTHLEMAQAIASNGQDMQRMQDMQPPGAQPPQPPTPTQDGTTPGHP